MDPATLPHPTLPRYYDGEQEKRSFVRGIFNKTARDYDRVERFMALGSGSWYRRQALLRAGLVKGMRVLDVAVGTGLVAREEVAITGDARLVTGLDPSVGMLTEARLSLPIRAVLATAEEMPLESAQFDFLSMGYALRHLADLSVVFGQFYRVLRPGGRVCILEITRPASRAGRFAVKTYMRVVVPMFTRIATRRADSQLLWQYYWDTIEACVSPAAVMEHLKAAGFVDVSHHVELGLFSEVVARKPD